MWGGFGDPFAALDALQRALDSRLDSSWMGDRAGGMGGYPPINIFQKGDDFVALIELPGIDKAELNIEAKERAIRISGKKTVNYGDKASMHRRERPSGIFDRTISLPLQIDAGSIRAEYRDGLLSLFVPRAESEKPRAIQIK